MDKWAHLDAATVSTALGNMLKVIALLGKRMQPMVII